MDKRALAIEKVGKVLGNRRMRGVGVGRLQGEMNEGGKGGGMRMGA